MGGAKRAVEKVGSGIESVVSGVVETAEAIAEDPLPTIATAALIYVGVPPEVASAAVTAANGGSVEQIATAYVVSAAGSQAAQSASAGATSAGSSATTAKIAASAAGASTATTLKELDNGKPLGEALESGLKSGVVAGSTTGVIEAGQSALAPPETGQGIKAVPGKSSQLLKDSGLGEPGITEPSLLGDQTKVSGLGLTDKVPTGGGQGLVVDTSVVLPTSLKRYDTDRSRVRGTEEGGLQPAYTSAGDSSGITPSTPYQEPRTVTEIPKRPISPTTEALARPLIAGGLSELFGFGPKVPGAPSVGDSSGITQTTTTGTTVGLTGTGGAGEIESKESGKKRSNVWNEESLRLKDALGV
jgi:hypothetical protein